MKYTIIELDTDNQEIIDKFWKELQKGIVVIPKRVVNIIQFETEEDLKEKNK